MVTSDWVCMITIFTPKVWCMFFFFAALTMSPFVTSRCFLPMSLSSLKIYGALCKWAIILQTHRSCLHRKPCPNLTSFIKISFLSIYICVVLSLGN